MNKIIFLSLFLLSNLAQASAVKEWTIEIEGVKNFSQFSDFKNKLKTYLSDSASVVERTMNRSQIIVILKGKTSLGEIKSALNQMTPEVNGGKMEWKVRGSDDSPYFSVEFK
ncbi:MAG: hypothetical protein KA715_07235 [Xanthomonadaceae bacterium]|nr:hypothetical protein [Xanthomonadaceae bacterium]